MTTVTATWIEKTDTFTFKSDKYKATYENIKFIGQGGVGEVYSCRNTATNQKLAIKKITKHCEIIFQSEPIIRALKHPHLMETYDIYYVEAQNRPTILFFTMVYYSSLC
jgi:serine/threonine protein kinase